MHNHVTYFLQLFFPSGLIAVLPGLIFFFNLSLRGTAGPPSAPQNLVYNINQTAVSLEWSPPADAGGRNDVTYRVICRRCGWEAEECAPCGPNVGYLPAQSGLVETYASVVDLLAHANYTLEVEAVNGVSDLGRTQRLFAAVSIATGQAGELLSGCLLVCALIVGGGGFEFESD